MNTARFMSNYELRASLELKDRQISRLKEELTIAQKENETLRDWNNMWQTATWSRRLASQCDYIHKEIKGLSYIQTKLLKYVAGLVHKKGERHLRSISRALCIPPSTASVNLSILQSKGLVRSYYRNTKFKRFYALPETMQFLDN